MKVSNYWVAECNGTKSYAFNSVLPRISQMLGSDMCYSQYIALGSGSQVASGNKLSQPFAVIEGVISDSNYNVLKGDLFVSYSVTIDSGLWGGMSISEIGFCGDSSLGKEVATYANFSPPIVSDGNQTIVITAMLYLNVAPSTLCLVADNDNMLVKAMLGIVKFDTSRYFMCRDILNYANTPMYRDLPPQATLEPLKFVSNGSSLVARYNTGSSSNPEMLICYDTSPVARISYNQELTTEAMAQYNAPTNGFLELTNSSTIDIVTSVTVNNIVKNMVFEKYGTIYTQMNKNILPYKFPTGAKIASHYDGDYIAVYGGQTLIVLDVNNNFESTDCQNIKIDASSIVKFGNGKDIFVSYNNQINMYKYQDGKYSHMAIINGLQISSYEVICGSTYVVFAVGSDRIEEYKIDSVKYQLMFSQIIMYTSNLRFFSKDMYSMYVAFVHDAQQQCLYYTYATQTKVTPDFWGAYSQIQQENSKLTIYEYSCNILLAKGKDYTQASVCRIGSKNAIVPLSNKKVYLTQNIIISCYGTYFTANYVSRVKNSLQECKKVLINSPVACVAMVKKWVLVVLQNGESVLLLSQSDSVLLTSKEMPTNSIVKIVYRCRKPIVSREELEFSIGIDS